MTVVAEHAPVAVAAPDLAENAILLMRRTATNPQVPERVTGEVLAVDLPARALRTALTVLA